jgi:hypothetical protein
VAVLNGSAASEQRRPARTLGARALVVGVVAGAGVVREDDPVLDGWGGQLKRERGATEASGDERQHQRELCGEGR